MSLILYSPDDVGYTVSALINRARKYEDLGKRSAGLRNPESDKQVAYCENAAKALYAAAEMIQHLYDVVKQLEKQNDDNT